MVQQLAEGLSLAQNDLQAASTLKLTQEQKTEKLNRLRTEMGDAAWSEVG